VVGGIDHAVTSLLNIKARAVPTLPDVAYDLFGLSYERVGITPFDNIDGLVGIFVSEDDKRCQTTLEGFGQLVGGAGEALGGGIR
jgi:hypothetical protein